MNAHARHNTSKSRAINLPVSCIVMHDFFPVPLSDAEEKVLHAYEQAIKNKKGITDAAKITEINGTGHQTRVSRHLWELNKCGRAVAYHRQGKWIWCTPEVAEGMLKYYPHLLTRFEDLIIGNNGLPTGNRKERK